MALTTNENPFLTFNELLNDFHDSRCLTSTRRALDKQDTLMSQSKCLFNCNGLAITFLNGFEERIIEFNVVKWMLVWNIDLTSQQIAE